MSTEGRTDRHDEAKRLKILHFAHTVHLTCFVWMWKQTAIISPYSTEWLVFITGWVCLLRGTDWVFVYKRLEFLSLKVNQIEGNERKHESAL